MKIGSKSGNEFTFGGLLRKIAKPKPGVTLIELVIVVAILGSLIYILTSTLADSKDKVSSGVYKVQFQKDKALIRSMLDEYKQEYGNFPDPAVGLPVLFEQVPGAPDNWKAMGKKKQFLDPYKNLYKYELDEGGEPRLISLGADKKEGGTGANEDVDLAKFD